MGYSRVRRHVNRFLLYFVLIVTTVVMVGPFVWLVLSSLKEKQDMYSIHPTPFARRKDTGRIYVTFENYTEAFDFLDFPLLAKNTLIVAIINTSVNLLLNSMAGYAFARINFPGRDKIFKIMLMSLMVPATVLLIPNLLMVKTLGMYNTKSALIFPFVMSVYNVFMMRQFFMGVPASLEEAARVDGAGRFRTFFQIVLPLVRPAVVTQGVFTFLWNYNNFLWPLVALIDKKNYTLALGLGSLVTVGNTRYHVLIASSVVVALPLIVLFLIFQRYIVEGIMAGSLKG
ncbi:MAG: carbohydrate ABC transporter permease [Clostridia bacterium]|nr:carbohydrate ABC transporter permease [Clostridia bacterium]